MSKEYYYTRRYKDTLMPMVKSTGEYYYTRRYKDKLKG
jgi:hypothetical protein